nr:peptidyl-prolyl cis-trans isomerase FKBP42 [Ipomoea trifida]
MIGLAIGISGMRSGGRALLHVGWELAYGKDGSFSFPNVAPMANVMYEVELIGFDETKEAIAYMGDDFMFQLFGKYHDMALAVLVEDENNVRALFRRGKCRAELGQTDAAREDFLKACKFAP